MKISVGALLALLALGASAKAPGSIFGDFDGRNINTNINAGKISHDDEIITKLSNSHYSFLVSDLRGGSSKAIGGETTNSRVADVEASGEVVQSKKRGFLRRNVKKTEVTDSAEENEKVVETELDDEENVASEDKVLFNQRFKFLNPKVVPDASTGTILKSTGENDSSASTDENGTNSDNVQSMPQGEDDIITKGDAPDKNESQMEVKSEKKIGFFNRRKKIAALVVEDQASFLDEEIAVDAEEAAIPIETDHIISITGDDDSPDEETVEQNEDEPDYIDEAKDDDGIEEVISYVQDFLGESRDKAPKKKFGFFNRRNSKEAKKTKDFIPTEEPETLVENGKDTEIHHTEEEVESKSGVNKMNPDDISDLGGEDLSSSQETYHTDKEVTADISDKEKDTTSEEAVIDDADESHSAEEKVSNDSSFAQFLDNAYNSNAGDSQSRGATTKSSKEGKRAGSGIFSFGRKRKGSSSIITPHVAKEDSDNGDIDASIIEEDSTIEKQGRTPGTEVDSQVIDNEILNSKDNVEREGLDNESNKKSVETVSDNISTEDSTDRSPIADDEIIDRQDDTKNTKDVGKEKKTKKKQKVDGQFGFRRSIRNAVPWIKDNNESSNDAKPVDNSTTNSNDDQKKKQQPLQQQQRPMQPIPFGGPLPANGSPFDPVGPSPPIILTLPSAIPPRHRYPQGMPMRPQSQTDATIAGLVTSLLPLLSRLAILTFLSSFSLFGHGESQIYAPNPSQHFMFERLNDRYERDGLAMQKALTHPPHKMLRSRWSLVLNGRKGALKKKFAQMEKEVDEVAQETRSTPPSPLYSRTVIVLDFQTTKGDMQDIVKELSDAVTFILSQYLNKRTRLEMGKDLEVIICVESPGGIVQDFGLAADQLIRIKEAAKQEDLTLTVCVDKIAASGGYLMACHATQGQLMAAPFAVIGSIGVLRETINIHDVLKTYGVRPLLLTAGNAKAPLTSTNEVTEEKLAIVQKDLEKVHDAFREMVKDARGDAIAGDFDDVTNGDVFLGKDAVDKGLVDHLKSSDEYIAERVLAGDRVLRLHKYDRNRMGHLRLSPLDLLLLKTTDGTLGKMLGNMMQKAIRIGPQLLKVGGMMGAIKLADENYQGSLKRRRLQDDI